MSVNNKKVIRVGSRKSELALIQTKHVIECLKKLYPEQVFEIHTMTTMGDRILNISLPKIGEKALFTKDLEDALINGTVDFVVHSLKDLPTCLPDGMAIGAILEREDPRDALVLNAQFVGHTLKTLPAGSIVGTSSLRRGAQLARCFPHLIVQDIRGNLNTRLAKLDAPNSKFAGIILAQAGLERMKWQNRISQTIEPADMLYAVGQGALAVECRSTDAVILAMLRKLHCVQTQCKILTERSFLKTLGGGCSAPVAVNTILKRRSSTDNEYDFDIKITGAVWSLDGKTEVLGKTNCSLNLDCESEIIPCKKIRLDNEVEVKPTTPPKSKSPTIIDDLKATCSTKEGDNYDIAELINIHGDLFKKCPYSQKLSVNDSNENSVDTDESEKCPLKHAVGQDVMGQCPFFASHQKILASRKDEVDNVPILTASLDKKQHSGEGDVKDVCPVVHGNRTDNEVASKCPYLASDVDSTPKCPFISKTEPEPVLEKPVAEVCSIDDLFCGLYRHKCIRLDLYEKCEALGHSLANNLIENGALKVMEVAQLEIRRKV